MTLKSSSVKRAKARICEFSFSSEDNMQNIKMLAPALRSASKCEEGG